MTKNIIWADFKWEPSVDYGGTKVHYTYIDRKNLLQKSIAENFPKYFKSDSPETTGNKHYIMIDCRNLKPPSEAQDKRHHGHNCNIQEAMMEQSRTLTGPLGKLLKQTLEESHSSSFDAALASFSAKTLSLIHISEPTRLLRV